MGAKELSMSDQSKRTTFEEKADLYNELRSGYPEELIEDIIRFSQLPTGGRILEIGCGSGNATVSFARSGFRILGIELGERLAQLATLNCKPFPGVNILDLDFEDWTVEEKSFDLVLSADALHWIPVKIGYPRSAQALKDSGSAAFFWRVPVDPQTDWSRAVDRLYQAAPQFVNPDKRFTAEWLIGLITRNFANSGCFGEVTHKQYFWSETQTSEQYVNGLRTFSMHQGIDEQRREQLYTDILEMIQRFGGQVEQPQSVVLFQAKVKR